MEGELSVGNRKQSNNKGILKYIIKKEKATRENNKVK